MPLPEAQPSIQRYPSRVPDWSRPIIATLVLVALALGIRSLLTSARARRLEAQRARLLDDVDVLQRALVPEVAERLGSLSISAAYCPAEGPGAGGDFYDVFPLDDGRVALILGDVAGHGRGAIERAAFTRYTIRAYIEAGLEPGAALRLANSVLGEDDDQRFVTVAVAVFDEHAGLLTYSLAGHHPPLLLGAGIREPLDVCSSPPIGLGLMTGLRQTTVSLGADAVACFFTDGLVEARVGDTLLGRERLERLLVADGPRADALALLRHPVDHAADDRAVCLVRVSARVERPPLHVEELDVQEWDHAGAHYVQFLEACGVAGADVAAAIAAARGAGEDGVLLHVELSEAGGTVTVKPRDRGPFERSAARVRQPG